MMRTILFDFDGVIADTEPIHYSALKRILADLDITLTEADYYASYLGFDDRGCFTAALESNHRTYQPALITELVDRKARVYLDVIRQQLTIFPGVRDLVRAAAADYPLAIVSGALRQEIELILERAGIRTLFRHITSAENVARGKPDPEGFLHALAALNRDRSGSSLTPADCLVIEDSLPGIRGAHAAGMKVLAVANTHTVQDLHEADAITHSLEQVNLSELRHRLWKPSSQQSMVIGHLGGANSK
jgi:HAD superfamily hydrolase (TIGR01509 family)